jgi:hypothetical protein
MIASTRSQLNCAIMDSTLAVVGKGKNGLSAPKPMGITVVYPFTQADRNNLREILRSIGLESLYMVPWALKEESLLDFCLDKYNSKQLAGPIRGQTDKCDLECIANSFQLSCQGEGLVSQRADYTKQYFFGERDVGHGWKINQCKYTEMKMLSQFLLPIMHPRAPSYVSLRIGNTIIKAWKKGRQSTGQRFCCG